MTFWSLKWILSPNLLKGAFFGPKVDFDQDFLELGEGPVPPSLYIYGPRDVKPRVSPYII